MLEQWWHETCRSNQQIPDLIQIYSIRQCLYVTLDGDQESEMRLPRNLGKNQIPLLKNKIKKNIKMFPNDTLQNNLRSIACLDQSSEKLPHTADRNK